MAENKKYFYMRLKENFYDSDAMIAIESMPDGYKMSNLLMKMYCRSLKWEGRLAVSERIPYSPEMLATATRIDVETVKNALEVFRDLGLIEVLDSGTIYMLDIQAYIGKSSTEADRIRQYRGRIEEEKKAADRPDDPLYKCTDKCTDDSPYKSTTNEHHIQSHIQSQNIKGNKEDKEREGMFSEENTHAPAPAAVNPPLSKMEECLYKSAVNGGKSHDEAMAWIIRKRKAKDGDGA